MSFEKIILQHDTRGISELSKFLVPDFCINAAKLTLENIGTVFITTGFYIKKSKAIETDFGFDIDTEWQHVVIEYWLRKRGYTETSIPWSD